MTIDLGSTAVLDPDKLTVGARVEIDNQLFKVNKIEGINVFFTPVSGWELWMYRWNKLSLFGKLAVFVVVVVVGSVIWLFLMHMGGQSNAVWY